MANKNSSDLIRILIDEFEEVKHQQHLDDSRSQHKQQHKKQHQKHKQKQSQATPTLSAVNSNDNNTDIPCTKSTGESQPGLLLIQDGGFKRERRNSWCSSRPSEALANLKRKWFAGVSNTNGKAVAGDDNDDVAVLETGKSKSFSLTSLDGEGSTSDDDRPPTDQTTPAINFLDRPSSTTLSSSPVPAYRGDDRFLGDDLFSGRNARSEQDVRGHHEKVEDKLIEVPDLTQFRGERFSLESDNLFAVKMPGGSPSVGAADVQTNNQLESGKRSTSPTPLRGCPDKSNRSDHPNLDLLVARHKSEGSLQKYPIKEIKIATVQRKSSVLSKINSYRNSRKISNKPTLAVDTHNFVSISSSSTSSSSHFSIVSPSSLCEVCNKPFTHKKTPLKCLDCGLLTHHECKEQAASLTCSTDESKNSSTAKSDDVSDSSIKFNKGNSSATTTTDSDSLDLPDLSMEEGEVSACSSQGTTTGAPSLIGGNDEEEAWSLTVDENITNSMSQAEIKRQNLIWELIRNEKHHYRILKMMLKIFVAGLKTEVGLDSSLVNQLFPGLDGLIVVHGNILKALLKQQNIRPDKRIDDLSAVLLEQFGSTNGQEMEILYGDFCSQHERAINLYKELKRCDRKFQNFINKCVGIVACERRGIDSCILTVTQRLTKYPLLVDQILKYTDDDQERKGLSEFLQLVRSIISAVNDRIDFVARKERFDEIFDKLDPKSTTTYGNKIIKKADILNMEKYLKFHGWTKLKTARGRTIDTLVVVLNDWIIMLSENNHKYFFSNIDNKSSMIPLSQLLVREKDDKYEGRNFFLISSNREAPAEMYELVCKSNSELKYWTSVLRQATALLAAKTDTHLDLMSMVKSDQAHLISLIETLQNRDEEIKTSLNQKLSAIEDFYRTLDKLSPNNTINESIKQMAEAKVHQHLSPEDLVLSLHVQETNLIASLQCGAASDPMRRSLSKDQESSSLESLSSRRTSTASLFSKASLSSSFRIMTYPSFSSSTADASLHHSSSDVVDVDSMNDVVDSVKIKRKTSDASVVETKYNPKVSHGMLPGFLSIFHKDKEDQTSANDGEEIQKHRKQPSLTSPQNLMQPPLQAVLQHRSSLLMHHMSQQLNKATTPEQQQQQPNNRAILTQEVEDRLCNFLNSVHNLSTMVIDLHTDCKRKEVQIICMTKQLEKFEKQLYPMDHQMEELRSVQNQVQMEKFQLQELRIKNQEDVDRLNNDLKNQNQLFEQQKAEIKSHKDELQRQRDALQRQIDLFEEHKSSFTTRMNQTPPPSLFHHQLHHFSSVSSDVEDSNNKTVNSKYGKQHVRNHSNPLNLTAKSLSTVISNSTNPSRSGSPSVSQQIPLVNSTILKQQQQVNKHGRSLVSQEMFEPPVDEKNGVLVTKKDSVPLLPVHLVSAKNETKLAAITIEESSQVGPIKQMLPTKLATITNSKQQPQHTNNKSNNRTSINNDNTSINRMNNEIADNWNNSLSPAYLPKPSGPHKICNKLPLHLAEKSRILPSSSSSSSLPQITQINNTAGRSFLQSISSEDGNNTSKLPSNSNSAKATRSIFGNKKLTQLLSPSSPSSNIPPLTSSALEAMVTSPLLSSKVPFLSFQSCSSAGHQPSSSSSSSSLSSSSSSTVSKVVSKFETSTLTSSTSKMSISSQPASKPKTATKPRTFANKSDDDDEIIFL